MRDASRSYTHFLNPIDLTARYSCHSDHPLVWLLLELGFFLALLSWGIYVVYSTWSGKASRWTLIAVYNTLMAILVIVPLLATAAKTDDWVFFIAALAIDFTASSVVFSIYGAALLRRIWESVRDSSGNSGNSRDASSPATFRVGQTTTTV